jgi:hypothetical protein
MHPTITVTPRRTPARAVRRTMALVTSGLLAGAALTLCPAAAQAAEAPTITADVQIGGEVDYTFTCVQDGADQWFRDGQPVTGHVINRYVARPDDLGRRISVRRTCADGGTQVTPETNVVTNTAAQLPAIGSLTQPAPGLTSLNSPNAQASVVGDPTDPGFDLYVGQLDTDNETLVDPSALTVSVAAVAKALRVAPLDASGVSIAGTGSVRHVSFAPTERGNVTLVFTVTGTTGATASYSLDYYASAATTPTSRVLQMSSDASSAIAAGDGYMFVADDEAYEIRLYDAERSGAPVAVFKPGPPSDQGEIDYESSARTGDSVFWLGSQGNSKKGEVQTNRHIVYETKISDSGANAKITPVGKYAKLRTDLVAWDQANGNRYGFAAATAAGHTPDGPAEFNIEGSEFAPDGTTLYLGFRAPLVGGVAGGKALIVPVTNVKQLTGGQASTATFGAPIEFDLDGQSIREIRKNAAGEYLILTGNGVPDAHVKKQQFLWYWNGDPQTVPEELSTNLPLDAEECTANWGAWEGIGEMPAQLNPGTQVRLIMDQGYDCPYSPSNTGVPNGDLYEVTQQKDLKQDLLRKARTDLVTLTGALGFAAEATGSGAFGEQRVGTSSVTHPVTITNTGAKPVTIESVAVTDEDDLSAEDFSAGAAACVGTTLAVGATCETQVQFAPKRAGATSHATLSVASTANAAISSLSLTGTASSLFTTVSTPSIDSRSPRVGDTLQVSAPAWAPAAEFSYQWLRDGQPIDGATSASYTPTTADLGHAISVTVTGAAAGYVPESRTSDPTERVVARTAYVTKRVKPTVSIKALSKHRVQVTLVAKGLPAKYLNQKITVKVAGVRGAYRVKLTGGKATIRLTGAKAREVGTGEKTRVSVQVPKLTTRTTTSSVVTTYEIAGATKRQTVKVRR